ncbi:MAG: DNA mismatch repair protein MutS [Planctomycetes bacterium]|nr:DNA mismatch repair protein MutS [Planctomycetota bacterium]
MASTTEKGKGGDASDTPMMRQYHAAKERFPKHLLFFRMGDFFELFFEDAKIAARALGLTLTARSKGPEAIAMAGVPAHSVEQYLARLLRQGFSVAICDQTEDASQAKGLVNRDITRVVTPGTVVEEGLLDARKPNRLVAVLPVPDSENGTDGENGAYRYGLAAVDLAAGSIHVQELADRAALASELARLAPSECLLPEPPPLPPGARRVSPMPPASRGAFALSELKEAAFAPREAHGRLVDRFGRSKAEAAEVKKLIKELPLGAAAAGALVGYLGETHPGGIAHLQPPRGFDPDAHLILDETAIRSLELVETIRDRAFEGSLLWAIDRTRTGAGARRLREWVLRPLRNLDDLRARQEAVHTLVIDPTLREHLREELKELSDLERISGRLGTLRATPRDLVGLKSSLRKLPSFESALEGLKNSVFAAVRARIGGLGPVADRIEATLEDDCPINVSDGGLIRKGVDKELDRLRGIAHGGKEWIARFQAEEAEKSGIPNLKIGYNRVFGYYLEVSKGNLHLVPKHFERRQTLTNAERFITPELKEREAEVLGAEDKIRLLEGKLFHELRDEVAQSAGGLREAGVALSELDALCSLAEVAARRGHVRPVLSSGGKLSFTQMRHPVLEETLPKGEVVANDLELRGSGGKGGKGEAPQVLLLTGPNMAGKSTYIRCAALCTILAQMGAFVPAEKAEVGLADRIFTRVGAADDLYGGRSTFMVEMAEVAEIVAGASDRSLVVLDEVGRGTSTYDGISLAWALVEHLHEGPSKPRTLFATHYHELCTLEEELPRVANANAVVKEWQGEISFLFRIVPGPSERSFGIHVARLAGLPKTVIERATAILNELEAEAIERLQHLTGDGGSLLASGDAPKKPKRRRLKPTREDGQLLLFEPTPEQIDPKVKELLDALRGADPNALSPMEALQKLAELVKKAKG